MTTDNCIIYFVSLKVIMQIQNFYLHAMMDNKLKQFVLRTPRPERAFVTDGNGFD